MTTFGDTKLSEEAQNALFGDLEAPPTDAEETPAPADVAVEEPAPEQPVEPETPAEVPAQPAADDGEQPVSGEVVSPPDEEPAPEEVPEPALDETDWKQRYADLRATEMPALARERERADLAEQQLVTLLQQQQAAAISPDRLDELTKRANELGMDPEQMGVYADIASEATAARTQPVIDAMTQQAAAARLAVQQAELAAEQRLIEAFTAAHEDLDDTKQAEVARFLYDVGAAYFVDPNTEQEMPDALGYDQLVGSGILRSVEPLTPDVLEIAYRAVTQPAFGNVLRAMPELYARDEGIKMAERLASQVDPTVTTRPNVAAIDESLASAQTLGGPSAPPPVETESLLNIPEKKFFSQ